MLHQKTVAHYYVLLHGHKSPLKASHLPWINRAQQREFAVVKLHIAPMGNKNYFMVTPKVLYFENCPKFIWNCPWFMPKPHEPGMPSAILKCKLPLVPTGLFQGLPLTCYIIFILSNGKELPNLANAWLLANASRACLCYFNSTLKNQLTLRALLCFGVKPRFSRSASCSFLEGLVSRRDLFTGKLSAGDSATFLFLTKKKE